METALKRANTLPQALGEVSDFAQNRECLTLDQELHRASQQLCEPIMVLEPLVPRRDSPWCPGQDGQGLQETVQLGQQV